MAINAKVNEHKEFERPSIGNVQAVCTAVRDVGLQRETGMYGEKIAHKVVVVWELKQTLTTGEFAGKRMVQSKRYTLSMFEKANLRKDIESWRGKKFVDEAEACRFDLEKLIGKNCLLNLQESKDGKYVNIAGVTPLMTGMNPMVPELNPDHVYKWIDDLAAKALPEAVTEADADEIPFSDDEPPAKHRVEFTK